MLRKHVKIESRRFYYWCDQLGILVWQDMPNGDQKIGPKDPDIVRSKASARQFEKELTQLVNTHYNHPSIVMWVPFNEGWGQYDTERIVNFTRQLDPGRLVNHASGWTDRGLGDVNDIHNYPGPRSPEPEKNRAIVLGEFGGLGLKVSGHSWEEENWGYSNLKSGDDLQQKYEEYYTQVWGFRQQFGLSASVYTQITDVETEANGLLSYDREVVKVDVAETRAINTNRYIPAPLLSHNTGLYRSDEPIEITSLKGGDIYYTTDGTEPTISSVKYTSPVSLEGNVVLSAKVFKGGLKSRTTSVQLTETSMAKPHYTARPDSKYTLGGDFALLDGQRGGTGFRDGKWQGFNGNDFEIVLDYGKATKAETLEIGLLEDTRSWIFLPDQVTLWVSKNGKKFKEVEVKQLAVPMANRDANIQQLTFDLSGKFRYVKIKARNIGKCPDWHGGGSAWLFTDEITLK